MSEASTHALPAAGHPHTPESSGLYDWVVTVDHKRIGILYLLTALVFFGAGCLQALFMRLQLAEPNNTLKRTCQKSQACRLARTVAISSHYQ